MDILALHLSPNQGGTSDVMLDCFAQGVEKAGAKMLRFSVAGRQVEPCRGCGSCNSSGQCVIKDDLAEFYPTLAGARNIVVATSLYFYDVPAKGKALIDRSQALWARRYVLNLKEALKPDGRGFLLALGATRGKNLFIPVGLSIRYFFDALGLPKTFDTLFLPGLEKPGDLTQRPDLVDSLREAGQAFGRQVAEGRAERA
ncbi:MAG: flavodoxin family protein [Candidatus Adiutrix sp.]|jgi:multimeric flavodoxin WrbA|nr:flavodoxin family protein [Candidatus Adiutrix sp.]